MIKCIWSANFDKLIDCDKKLNCEGCDVLKYIHDKIAQILLDDFEKYKKTGISNISNNIKPE